jgi:hypothetical protein
LSRSFQIRLLLLVLIFPLSAVAEDSQAAGARWVSAPQSTAVATLKVPVEVVSQGRAPEWILVEVEPQSIPEPSVVAMWLVAGMWILRRKRS